MISVGYFELLDVLSNFRIQFICFKNRIFLGKQFSFGLNELEIYKYLHVCSLIEFNN